MIYIYKKKKKRNCAFKSEKKKMLKNCTRISDRRPPIGPAEMFIINNNILRIQKSDIISKHKTRTS